MSRWNIMGNVATEIGNWIISAMIFSQNIENIHRVALPGITECT